MVIVVDPPYDTVRDFPAPVPETQTQRQEDLWHYHFPWVKTAVGASAYGNSLMIENRTAHLWMLWHRYHALGSIAPQSHQTFHLDKSGLLLARQYPPPPQAEHILLDLRPAIFRIAIVDVTAGEGFYCIQVVNEAADGEERIPEAELAVTRMIEELALSANVENALKRLGISTVDQLASKGLEGLASLKELDADQRAEIVKRMVEQGIL